MIRIERKANTPRFVPDYMAKSIADVDFALLRKQGIRYVAFDADSTLVSVWGRILPVETRQLLRKKLPLFTGWCIASNRITNDLQPLGDSINAGVVRASIFTRKPSKRFFRRVFLKLNATPRETVMIGDKLIADMWGGKRSGMTTVWVEHIGNDNPLDRVLRVRWFEKWLMKAYVPKAHS
jgi:HAD superfamily phosphatase (TIGR01668 family)